MLNKQNDKWNRWLDFVSESNSLTTSETHDLKDTLKEIVDSHERRTL